MDRVLDLQKLSTAAEQDVTAAGSSSSWAGCACSTNSWSGCGPIDPVVAI